MDSVPPIISSGRLGLYTPFQVRLATFIGGPFAAIYTLQRNFKQLGNRRGVWLTWSFGALFVVVLLAVLPFLPERFPNSIIPLLYSLGAGSFANAYQLSKETILGSDLYFRHSGWNVTAVCVISLLSFCVIVFTYLFGLESLGVINLEG